MEPWEFVLPLVPTSNPACIIPGLEHWNTGKKAYPFIDGADAFPSSPGKMRGDCRSECGFTDDHGSQAGSSVVIGDFDQIIASAKSARFIGVVGPSAGWLPDPAFRRGVHAVAATKIIDISGAHRAIMEGGGTPHFIRCGHKYTLTNQGIS